MADTLVRVLAADGAVRGLAAVTTGLVDEARARHDTLPTATAALGRTLTAALLLASTLKRDERLSIDIAGDGPLRRVLADATADGGVRGFVQVPHTHLPPKNGKLDVGGAVGAGQLCVMRVPVAGGAPYRSIVPLVSGEIGEDVAHYLLESEQVPSAVGLGVFVDTDGRVAAAGGWLLQAMPGAPDDVLDRLAGRVDAAASPTEMVRAGHDPLGMLAALLGDAALDVLEERPVAYRCRCTRERVLAAIMAMGREEIAAVADRERRAEVVCEFCGRRWTIEEPELRALLTPGGRS